jgi:hypothetical protein
MMKAFKFRIEVSEAIEQKFEATIDICREPYNSGGKRGLESVGCKVRGRKPQRYKEHKEQIKFFVLFVSLWFSSTVLAGAAVTAEARPAAGCLPVYYLLLC